METAHDRPEPFDETDRPVVPTGEASFAHRAATLSSRAIEALGRMAPGAAVATMTATVLVGWVWIYTAGGASHVPPHWFYIPIMMAAVRFGIPGALTTAIISGLVAGPLLPADVDLGAGQLPSDQIVRGIWFVVIGLLDASILTRLKESLSREAEIARREAELATHKAAVIATVSHEFRTPLTVLLGSSKMLASQGGHAGLDATLFEGILTSARRLNDLVNTVLAVSEGPLSEDELAFAPVSPQQIVSSIASRVDPRDVGRLRMDLGDERVWTDPAILESLLRQLIDNALKFSPPEEVVEVAAKPHVRGGLQIVVADRGPGIDPRFVSRAFDPFTQQDPAMTRTKAGLGVGLFVARRLAHHLGVPLELRAREGGGTEAVVTVQTVGGSDLLPPPHPDPRAQAGAS